MRPKDKSDEKVLDPLSAQHSSGALEAIRLEPRGQTEPLRSLSGDTAVARSSQQQYGTRRRRRRWRTIQTLRCVGAPRLHVALRPLLLVRARTTARSAVVQGRRHVRIGRLRLRCPSAERLYPLL